jgi:Domain of unknown function (DUF6285)
MQDPPTAAELLRAVADFMRTDLAPQLSGHLAFRMRVALNALDLVARQFELEGDSDQAEAARLSQLLGTAGSLEALNRTLCASIAQSEDKVTPEILDHLWQTTLEKLAIDQPGYESYRRESGKNR